MLQHTFVHVAIPTHTIQLYALTVDSLFREYVKCAEAGYLLFFDQLLGSSDVIAVRNSFLSRFYFGPVKAEKLLFIDCDIGWDEGAILKLVKRDVGVVTAAYPVKQDPEDYRVHFLEGPIVKVNPHTGEPDPDGLISIDCAPGGMVCVSREAAGKLIEAHADDYYIDSTAPNGKSYDVFGPLFLQKNGQRHRFSEDLSFGKRWRALGEKLWLDPSFNTYHVGPKVFKGNMEKWLIARRDRAK